MFNLKTKVFRTYHVNTIDPYIPEIWAQESLMVLRRNLVAAQLVHQDFSGEIQNFGDTIHTRRPSKMYTKRKGVNDNVTVQDVSSTDVEVKLNQQHHISFLIRDGEESKGMQSLVETFLVESMGGIARGIDQMVLSQSYQFMENSVGKVTDGWGDSDAIALKTKMDNLLIPSEGRWCICTPSTEGDMLGVAKFTEADKIGNGGESIRNGATGKLYGINYLMSQSAPHITPGAATETGAVNLTAGYAAGSTSIVSDGWTTDTVAGEWVTIDGVPYRVSGSAGTAPAQTLTLEYGLRDAVADNAVIVRYLGGLVNGAQLINFDGDVVVDGFTGDPQRGQLVTFNTGTARYGILEQSSGYGTSLMLDRPLDAAISDNDLAGIGPVGSYNFAFHRNAVALVARPLAPPAAGTGARSAVATAENGLSVRVTITYDGNKQGHLVTVDLLTGIKVLDTNLGVVGYAD